MDTGILVGILQMRTLLFFADRPRHVPGARGKFTFAVHSWVSLFNKTVSWPTQRAPTGVVVRASDIR